MSDVSCVECVRVNRYGYDASGRYWGRASTPRYRLVDSERGIDCVVFARNVRAARKLLGEAIAACDVRAAYWRGRVEAKGNTNEEMADMVWRLARRDAERIVYERSQDRAGLPIDETTGVRLT